MSLLGALCGQSYGWMMVSCPVPDGSGMVVGLRSGVRVAVVCLMSKGKLDYDGVRNVGYAQRHDHCEF